jgi:hypothetical protein
MSFSIQPMGLAVRLAWLVGKISASFIAGFNHLEATVPETRKLFDEINSGEIAP